MTGKNNFDKAKVVNDTWAKKCDKYLFIIIENVSYNKIFNFFE